MGTKLGRRSPEVLLGFAVALLLGACAQISGVGDLQFVGAHSDASASGGAAGAGGDTSGGAGGAGGDVDDANSGGGFSGSGGASSGAGGGAGAGGSGIGDAEAGGGGAGAGGFGGSGPADGSAGADVLDAASPLPCLDGGTLCPECMGALPSCCVTPSECGCIVPFFGGTCLNNRRDQ